MATIPYRDDASAPKSRMQTHFRTVPGRPQPGVEGPAKPRFILNDADLRAFEDGHDADMAKELAQADAMEAAGLSLPGRAGSGRGGKVTKADLEFEKENAALDQEQITLELALNEAIAARNANQTKVQALGGGGGRISERIALLQRELANGNPNADGYKIRAAELDKLQKFTAGQTEATAALGAAEAQIIAAQSAIESIPKRRAVAAQRRDFNLEAEMKLERKDRRGKREDREKSLDAVNEDLSKAYKAKEEAYGNPEAEAHYEGVIAELESRKARGGKRGKGKGETAGVDYDPNEAYQRLVADNISPEAAAEEVKSDHPDWSPPQSPAAPGGAPVPVEPAASPVEPTSRSALSLEPQPDMPSFGPLRERPRFATAIPVDPDFVSGIEGPRDTRRSRVGTEILAQSSYFGGGQSSAPPRAVLSLEPQPLDPPRIVPRQTWEGERNAQGIPLEAIEKASLAVRGRDGSFAREQERKQRESDERLERRERGRARVEAIRRGLRGNQ